MTGMKTTTATRKDRKTMKTTRTVVDVLTRQPMAAVLWTGAPSLPSWRSSMDAAYLRLVCALLLRTHGRRWSKRTWWLAPHYYLAYHFDMSDDAWESVARAIGVSKLERPVPHLDAWHLADVVKLIEQHAATDEEIAQAWASPA
jgi:hypothetical protein